MQRIRHATQALLGQQHLTHQINEWCEQYQLQCDSILSSRGVSLTSIAVVGAKGQGKTWVARQLIFDKRISESLPSGVLSSEATTHVHWIGPVVPEALDPNCELYHPCRSESMLDLGRPYMLLDTPGVTDDDLQAAKIAKDAMALSPLKLLVVRRDQLRGAILSQLAHFTEGAICVPVVTCVPLKDLHHADAHSGLSENSLSQDRWSESLRRDLETFSEAMRASAPKTKFLDCVLVPDFEADGDEAKIGLAFASELRNKLQNESLDDIAATRANRLSSATDRLRHRVGQLLDTQLPQLSTAVRKLHAEADALPSQTIEAVLGSRVVLQSAVRGRLRAQMIADTGMIWFPYRTVLTILGLTHGAWDRLLLSLSGSVPSIFGTFAAWARNVQQSRKINWEMHEGIRDRLNRQIQDRLEPIQSQFHRAVTRMRGSDQETKAISASPKIRLAGVEELQTRARSVFEWSVDRYQISWLPLQLFALVGTGIFWLLMAGPIVAIYREFLGASYNTLSGSHSSVDSFPHPSPALLFTSVLLSLIPLLIYAMVVLSWTQRRSKIHRIADSTYGEEIKLVDELKRSGVIELHYDDPLLEHAEFLIQCTH
ncbi:MAG: hypothetical protein NTY15_16620 [Planctomycetota bacterium]|nr:hypothetical protein [Planctomycetota bacterium]